MDEEISGAVRICFVNTQKRWAGGERWFLWAAAAMRDRGHDVVIATSHGSELAQRAFDIGVLVEAAETRLGASLRDMFRANRPDVVLCNSGGEARAAVRARKRSETPKVVLRRGLCKELGAGPVKTIYHQRVDSIFCNSEKTADVLRRAHPWLTGRKLTVMYNPVPPIGTADPGQVDGLRNELSLAPDHFVILSVGRLDEDKGHIFLVQAFRKVSEKIPRARLIIAGEGPERRRLERRIDELELADKARLIGFVRDLPPLYGIADVAAYPSLPGHESFSNSALEAMSLGLPVLATTAGGFPELIRDGQNGLLVAPGDAEALSSCLVRLARDKKLRAKIAETGHERVMSDFSPERKAEELASYLDSLI